MIVEVLTVERERGFRLAEPACGGGDVFGFHSTNVGNHGRRVVAHNGLEFGKAFGVRRDVSRVDQVFPEQYMQQRVIERDVGAGQDLQVQVGRLGGVGATRIDDDQLQRRVVLARCLDAPEQHRVRPRGIAAGNQQTVGGINVFIGTRRRIGPQRGLVASHRRAHAQARVGVDIVGADQALGQLVEDVVVLGQQLAADVEGDAVGAVLGDGLRELFSRMIERSIPTHALARRGLFSSQQWMRQPVGLSLRRHGQVQRAALGAQLAEDSGVVVAGKLDDKRHMVADEVLAKKKTEPKAT